MEDRPTHNKMEERDPFLWGLIALILGITAITLWHWYMS